MLIHTTSYTPVYIFKYFFLQQRYCSSMSSLAFTKNCRSFWCWSAIQPFAPHPNSLNSISLHIYRFLHLFLGNCILFISDCVSNLSRCFLNLILSLHITASPLTVSCYSQIYDNMVGFFIIQSITHIWSSMEHQKDPIKIPLTSLHFPFPYNYDYNRCCSTLLYFHLDHVPLACILKYLVSVKSFTTDKI